MPVRRRYRTARPAYRRKNKVGKGLTGGTGDVNPQWLILQDFTAAANQAAQTNLTSSGTNVPTNQLPMKSGASLVMEVLKVQFSDYAGASSGDNGAGFHSLALKNISSFSDAQPNKAGIIASSEFTTDAGTSASTVTVVDLTDGAGHGVLFAGQQLYHCIAQNTANSAGATYGRTFQCRVLYRWKYVTLTEYIGIVTAQLQ